MNPRIPELQSVALPLGYSSKKGCNNEENHYYTINVKKNKYVYFFIATKGFHPLKNYNGASRTKPY